MKHNRKLANRQTSEATTKSTRPSKAHTRYRQIPFVERSPPMSLYTSRRAYEHLESKPQGQCSLGTVQTSSRATVYMTSLARSLSLLRLARLRCYVVNKESQRPNRHDDGNKLMATGNEPWLSSTLSSVGNSKA